MERIPAGHGRAARLAAGQTVTVVNSHGGQVIDTWAFRDGAVEEFMSMAHTRSVNSDIYPRVGAVMVSNGRRPMLTWLEDSSPGAHDTLLCACNRAIYEELGVEGYHRNCEDNLHEALAAQGLRVGVTPAPLNLFMNTPPGPDGRIERAAPTAAAGDRVVMRAEMDLWIVFSACPQDLTVINGDGVAPRDAAFMVA